MKVLIQSHYPERLTNLALMRASLLRNGIKGEDITFLLDYGDGEGLIYLESPVIYSMQNMPINWWHGIAATMDTDYIALLCDDLQLLPGSLTALQGIATRHPEIDVFGYEGGDFAAGDMPYTGGTPSHTVTDFTPADYLIRFYFGKPEAFAKALLLSTQYPSNPIHDDLTLSLANKCALIPTTKTSGWEELPEHGVAYARRPNHYAERNAYVAAIRRRLNPDTE